MNSNFIYDLMKKSPLNGYHTTIGGCLSIVYGVTALLTGHGTVAEDVVAISGGIVALGLGSKIAQIKAYLESVKGILPTDIQAGVDAIQTTESTDF